MGDNKMSNNYNDDITKYRKKKESNVSKSNKKSKHKHNYVECFIIYDFPFNGKISKMINLSSYCDVCGKIGSTLLNGKIRSQYTDSYSYIGNKKYISPWTNKINEIYEKHKDEIPTFHIEDIFKESFVDLTQFNEEE